jgi:hypothetical protein
VHDTGNATERVSRPVKCARCAATMLCGERNISLNLTFEATEPGGGVGVFERHTLTQLCFGCASLLLTETVVQKKMLRPLSLAENIIALKKRADSRSRAPAGPITGSALASNLNHD